VVPKKKKISCSHAGYRESIRRNAKAKKWGGSLRKKKHERGTPNKKAGHARGREKTRRLSNNLWGTNIPGKNCINYCKQERKKKRYLAKGSNLWISHVHEKNVQEGTDVTAKRKGKKVLGWSATYESEGERFRGSL